MVNSVLPNQIDGRFCPIFEPTNPEMMEKAEDPRTKGRDLNTKDEQHLISRVGKVGT